MTMNTTKTCRCLVNAILTLAVSALAAQEPPPRYSGVPFPNHNISTDPFWWTDSRPELPYNMTAAIGTNTRINDQRALAMQIEAIRFAGDIKARQSVVWFSIPVVWFAGKACDLEVTWWQRTGGNGIFTIQPIYWTGTGFLQGNGTNGTGGSEWVKRTMRVPYAGLPEYGIIWTVQANTTTSSRWAQIDAVGVSYLIPSRAGNLEME